jgi:K+/H+ antiporter YhaU regulatory subunit KhtT
MYKSLERNIIKEPGRVYVRLYEVAHPAIIGMTVSELDVKRNTGATILALERSGTFIRYPEPDLPVTLGDRLRTKGTRAQLELFERVFPVARVFAPTALGQ